MYSRICIFGRPGSGKSTFALKLHNQTKLPLYHLDRYFFEANWVERNYQQFLTDQQSIVNQNTWIIDGNSLQSLEMRFAHADLCLYFNYPRWLCLYRLIRRIFYKNPAIKDRQEGGKERLTWKLIKYMWTFETRLDQRLIHQLKDLRTKSPHVKFIEIHSDKELNKECETLGFNASLE